MKKATHRDSPFGQPERKLPHAWFEIPVRAIDLARQASTQSTLAKSKLRVIPHTRSDRANAQAAALRKT